jgi:hypothetical protein
MSDKQSTQKKNRFLLPIGLAVIAASVLTVVAAYQLGYIGQTEPLKEVGRDYSLNPFSMIDAVKACHLEAKKELGPKLQFAVLNSHSSRFDENLSTYVIVMDAQVGTGAELQHTQVSCHVSPHRYMVDYFKAHGIKEKKFAFDFF